MKRLEVLPWNVYRNLVLVKEVDPDISPSRKHRKFLFRCKCWTEKEIRLNSVIHWNVISCWCIWRIRSKENWLNNKKHWFASWKCLTRIYRIHTCMKSRCNNPNRKDYKYYWWRWITYDPKWETFEGFYEDMKEWYQEHLTIDRRENDWNYCKLNCRWVTMLEQSKNKRNTLKSK